MGVLSDFVSAPAGAGPKIGESDNPTEHWQGISGWKGIDPIKLSTLHSLITSESLEVDPIVEKSGQFQLVGGDEQEGPWVLVFPHRITVDIGSLELSQIGPLGDAWSETEELAADGFESAEARRLITELSSLCRSALSNGNSVYLWISL